MSMFRHALKAVLFAIPATSFALTNFSPGDVSSLTADSVNSLLQTSALGTAHRAYQPASALGMLGFDVGIDFTIVSLPTDFQLALAAATQQPQSVIPGGIPVPRLNVHKGLPFNLDAGLTFASYQSEFTLIGLEAKYTFMPATVATPAIAARFSGNYSKLWFIQSHVYSLDALASKNLFYILEPYAGAGLQFWSGDLNVPLTGPQGLSANVSAHDGGTNPHFFAGAVLKLLLVHLTAELDHSFAGINTYGGKLSVAF